MTYQEDLIAHLASYPLVTDRVGSRIFADLADGDTPTPYVVYSVISTDGTTLHDATRNLEFPRIQFSCYADTKPEAVKTATAIRRSCEGRTISGPSDLILVFDDQSGTREEATNLFVEQIDFLGATNTNN